MNGSCTRCGFSTCSRLSHVFGQFLGIFIPPLLGATVVFENTLNPAEIVSTIRRERVSVLVAVPRLVDSLKQKIERDLESGNRPEPEETRTTDESGKARAAMPLPLATHRAKVNISSAVGGRSATSAASLDGNSGPSSAAARRWNAKPRNSGTASVMPWFKDTA